MPGVVLTSIWTFFFLFGVVQGVAVVSSARRGRNGALSGIGRSSIHVNKPFLSTDRAISPGVITHVRKAVAGSGMAKIFGRRVDPEGGWLHTDSRNISLVCLQDILN